MKTISKRKMKSLDVFQQNPILCLGAEIKETLSADYTEGVICQIQQQLQYK